MNENDVLFKVTQAYSEKNPSAPITSRTYKTFRLLVRMLYHWATGDSWELRPLKQEYASLVITLICARALFAETYDTPSSEENDYLFTFSSKIINADTQPV